MMSRISKWRSFSRISFDIQSYRLPVDSSLLQDSRVEEVVNQLYFVTYDELISGQIGLPFEFPFQIFSNPNEQPQPALRPVK